MPSTKIEIVNAKYCSQLVKDMFQTYDKINDIVNNGIENFKNIVAFIYLASEKLNILNV